MPITVNVYYAAASSWTRAAFDHAWSLLDRPERERAARFQFERDRAMYVCAHGLVRRALSRHGDSPPGQWEFEAGSHGRPEIARPASRLRFNLSHTRGLAACAVTEDLDVGFDVEDPGRGAPLEIADRWFAPGEVRALHALPERQRPERFFVYWTLKESYVKARGLGLSLPLHDFSFDTLRPEVRISFAPACGDNDSDWRFASWKIADHQAALAVRAASDLQITTTPL